jgi:hypothetical protein
MDYFLTDCLTFLRCMRAEARATKDSMVRKRRRCKPQDLPFLGHLAYPGVHHWNMRSDSSVRVVERDLGSKPGMCWHVRAGDDNLLLAVGEAIEALLSPTPPPPPPACTGCTPIAGGTPDSNLNSYCCHYTPVKSLKDQVRFATLC